MVLKINSYAVKTKGKAYLYDVLVQIQVRQKTITLNKSNVGAIEKINFQKLMAVVHQQTGKFKIGAEYAYDGVSILYSNKPFPGVECCLTDSDLPDDLKQIYQHDLIISIEPTTTNHVIDLEKKVENMSVDELSEYTRCISLVSCQDAINRNVFFADGNTLYKIDSASLKQSGIEFRLGFEKGIRFCTSGDGFLNPVIDIDAKIGAFIASQSVSDILKELGNAKATNLLSNRAISPSYNPHRFLQFSKFMSKTPKQQMVGKTNQTIYDYYRENKGIAIRADLPLVVVKKTEAGQFPSDVCFVRPYQKVLKEKLPEPIQSKLTSANVVGAEVRYRRIVQIVDDLSLNNSIVKAFNMTIATRMMEMPVPLSTKPPINHEGAIMRPKSNGNFEDKCYKFIDPGKADNWYVFRGADTDERIIADFVSKKLIPKARELGLVMSQPKECVSVDFGDVHFLREQFEQANADECKLIMCIENKPRFNAADNHQYIKLMEVLTNVVTQHVDYINVQNCRGGALQNLLNKVNLKLGGANYDPIPEKEGKALALDGDTFVIGLHVRHSMMSQQRFGPDTIFVREPSVFGITANCAERGGSFVGNYKYQRDPRSANDGEMIDPVILSEQVFNMFKLLKRNRPKKPSKIVILRSGVSHYNYDVLCEAEVRAVKNAATRFDVNWKPEIIYLVTTKEHGIRVFDERGGQMGNATPGTVIKEKVVKEGTEFLIAAHDPLKGTSKFVLVNAVLNESSVDLDGIIKFVHGLCYNHQLALASVSLPEPVFQASILAERGYSNFATFKEVYPNMIPWKDFQYDIGSLNEILSVNDEEMQSIRFTA